MNEKCKWEKKKGRKGGVLGLRSVGKLPWCEADSPLSLPTLYGRRENRGPRPLLGI